MSGSESIDLDADVLDSRDIIERIAYLDDDEYEKDEAELYELAALKAIAEEADGYVADWQYGEALIAESYFEDYARELADDIGAIRADAGWPLTYIDWPAAAEALKQDYTVIEAAGRTWYAR